MEIMMAKTRAQYLTYILGLIVVPKPSRNTLKHKIETICKWFGNLPTSTVAKTIYFEISSKYTNSNKNYLYIAFFVFPHTHFVYN